MATDLEIQYSITDSDHQRGIFRLYRAIYVSFLLNSHIFKRIVLNYWKTLCKFAASNRKR